ncbi:uncharacterized protein LOC110462978 isoform X3 [Mizuhopecten yessoensis]|uniref:uncharacterized protein LOC110462978 isoform X3 n=1 Tax=Mizuhopecten yessoensis TaxID=6573 RepID=UPI000B45DA37|nr:uncharacterized protein LOC110462978 isoform X3 [Mizuhopecten yessoensis]
MKHTSSLAFLVTTNMFKVLPLLLVFTGIVCAFQDVVFPKDDVGKSENLTTRYQEKPPGTTSHVRLELYTNRWKTRPERAAVSPSVQECPTKRGSLHYDERHKCPAIFCQHVSYRCDAQRSGQETGIDYELHNCTGTHRCSYERNIPENNIPISQVCDGVSQCPGSNDDEFSCAKPCQPFCVATKYGVQVPNGVYAWVMVFVLPVNAAVNPLLYTVSEVWRRRRRVNQSSSSHPWCNVLDTTQLLTK